MKIDYNKHIWEGWLVQDFINAINSSVEAAMKHGVVKDKKSLKQCCKDSQPYYKKHIPEVVNHFAQKYNLK